MEVTELTTEYSTGRRNIHQEMLFRNMKACCGDCSAYFHGWAMLMGQRNLVGRSARDYFEMDVPTFRRHAKACKVAMEDVEKVDACLQMLEGVFDKDWKNPADTCFTAEGTRDKMAEYRRIYSGESEWTRRIGGCGDDYQIRD